MFSGKLYDLVKGVETNNPVSEKELSFKNSSLYPYVPVDVISLKKILNSIDIENKKVFCDIGCGKGRSLLIADELGFEKLIGFEISEKLVKQARKNATHENFDIILADATNLSLVEEVDFVFIHCPFSDELFDRFLKNLESSLQKYPRELTLLYGFPIEHEKINKSQYFQEMTLPIKKYKETYKLYKAIVPAKS
jgi:SAM-dependent methyltransferase